MRYPLVILPSSFEQALFLIREELKSRRFFHVLMKVGIDDCDFRPHLDDLILRYIGLDSSDETFDRYMIIMDRRSRKINASRESITKQAIKAYNELVEERKRIAHSAGLSRPLQHSA